VYEQIFKNFESANPGITVSLTVFEELRDMIKPAITAGEGPDLFSYDAGAGYLGVLSNTGLALNLKPYAEKYNWNSRFFDWALDKTRYVEGDIYGIANQLEALGVFYNRKVFAANNLKTPNTYDEFIQVCQALLKAGITPVILTDKDQWPGFHYESIWMNSFAGPFKVKDAVATKILWTDPSLVLSMDKLQEFCNSPYVNAQINSIGYDDSNALLYSGGGAMRITGTWMVAEMIEKMGEDVGFFYLGPGAGDILSCPPGGLGEAIVINGKTKYPEETAALLDFMFNKQSVQIWYENGFIPSVKGVDYSSFKLMPLFKEIVDEINAAETLGENIDVLMGPKVNQDTQNYIQELIDKRITGLKAMERKQAALLEDIADGNYKTN
jgi:raffinose/stachyose/melibiose transport system substrate-binding protein